MRKIIAIFLIMIYFAIPASAVMQGHIEQTDTSSEDINKKLFTGDVEKLEDNDIIKMTVSQVLSSGYTQEGDEFFAEVSQDVASDKGIIIPAGSIAHGKVQLMQDSKKFCRDGYITVSFDYLVTPDGREIPIQAGFTSKNIAKGTAKAIAEHAGYTLVGGVAGGILAIQVLGIGAAVASNGYTVAGGAALGGTVGLIAAMNKKGNGVLIQPGDELKIKVISDIELPVFSKNAFRQEEQFYDGLNVRINNVVSEKDPFGEDNTITLSLGIDNYTDKTFTTFDIALVNNINSVFFPTPFGDTSLWFKAIAPGDRVIGKLSFCVNDKKKKHWLVFYDRKTKKQLARISIDNANQDIKEKLSEKKKNKKVKKEI